MNWVTMDPRHPSPPRRPSFRLPPPPAPHGFSLRNRVSPSVLLIIVVLAIIFFVCGLLHLLVRFIMRRRNGGMDELGVGTAFQGQLQQLFHLHDSGVDQFFIDSLPLFQYNAIIGLKKPFDCAICLCEFKAEDKLRLLPKCSHAFHMECIDTWLLSHSTCPLCRTNLLPDLSPSSSCSPSVMVLESGSENTREVVGNGEVIRPPDAEPGSARIDKPGEVSVEAEGPPGEKVLSVKLGKFKNVDGGEGSSTTTTTTTTATTVNINATTSSNPRRCFSMDSFGYVMDETAYLQVPIRTTIMKQSIQSRKLAALPLKPGQRVALSECDCQSMRYLSGLEAIKSKGEGSIQSQNANSGNADSSVGRGIVRKKESFSISKTWLMGRGEKPNAGEDTSSRRAFSFRFPVTRGGDPEAGNDIGEVNRATCEVEIGSEMDEDARSCNSLDYSQASSSYRALPSLTRRTLLWLMGRRAQNKVGHSSSSSVDQV